MSFSCLQALKTFRCHLFYLLINHSIFVLHVLAQLVFVNGGLCIHDLVFVNGGLCIHDLLLKILLLPLPPDHLSEHQPPDHLSEDNVFSAV